MSSLRLLVATRSSLRLFHSSFKTSRQLPFLIHCSNPYQSHSLHHTNHRHFSDTTTTEPSKPPPSVAESENEKREKEKEKAKKDRADNWKLFFKLCRYSTAVIIPYLIYKSLSKESIPLPSDVSNESLPITANIFTALPHRWGSRLGRTIFSKELPIWLRSPMYKFWGFFFPIDWSQFTPDLTQYRSFEEFFIRPLTVRRDISLHSLIAPCDGTVLTFGKIIDDGTGNQQMAQIKGVTYNLKQFLGQIPQLTDENNSLFYTIIYLCPGDYHRYHSACHWNITDLQHYPGHLFAVKPSWLKKIPGLFSLNERVILSGKWHNQWFFSYTAVGAYNVGTIAMHCQPLLQTNSKLHDDLLWYTKNFASVNDGKAVESKELQSVPSALVETGTRVKDRFLVPYGKHTKQTPNVMNFATKFEDPIISVKGEELGYFSFGSTIVLVFEASDFQFDVESGQQVRYGEALGEILT